jgi:hypothetical protein
MSGRRLDKKLILEARLGVCGKGTFELVEIGPGGYAGSFTVADVAPGEKSLETR